MISINNHRKIVARRIKRHARYAAATVFSTKNIFGIAIAVAFGSLILIGVTDKKPIHTDELLATIAQVESRGNYNAYFSNATNSSIKFTDMPIKEVISWQQQFINQGSASSAVGRYQFINTTLRDLVQQLDIDQNTIFTEQLQDQLAVALLERRGLREYVSQTITREQFAHNLSKEWAALPKVIGDDPEQSYYADDGLNQAQLSVDELFSGIETVREL